MSGSTSPSTPTSTPTSTSAGPVAAAPVLPCPGCGVELPPATGPTHAYIGSSPGCWALFGELTSTTAPAVPGQRVLDTYAVQHPGVPERRATQSVCAHLVSLCAALEHDWPAARAPDLLRRALARQGAWAWRWLDLPLPIGTITVREVMAVDGDQRAVTLRAWSADVWQSYAPHHALVRSWVGELLADR